MEQIAPKLVDEKTAARYIGFSPIWLRKGRCEGNPNTPAFVRVGRSIRYCMDDLNAFVQAHREPKGPAR